MLAARTWQRKYTPDDSDLVRVFYLWSPGNPLFEAPEFVQEAKDDEFRKGRR